MLIRINRKYRPGMTDDDIYQATRTWWRMSPARHDPEIAMAIYDGVVRGVYRVTGWFPIDPEDMVDEPGRKGRWGFNGISDAELSDRYLFADVTAEFRQGDQNPIHYVNC